MKKKKLWIPVLVLAIACATLLTGLTGCGGSGLAAPSDFTFDLTTRAYSFKTVDGADTYQICIEKILNDATGKSLAEGATITREEKGQQIVQPADMAATLVTKPGSDSSAYVWTSTINNTMNIKDTAGTGTVSGNLSIYQYQTKADGVTPVLLDGVTDEIPLGHYYVSCYALDAAGNSSEAAWEEIVVGGKLDAPKFSWSVADGKMKVSLNSSYIDSAIQTEGLPYSVDFTIDDGSGTKKTVSFDDWSYYTTVIGPQTSFNFMFLEKTIDVASASSYTVTAVAKGDGGKIADSDSVETTGSVSGNNTTMSVVGDTLTFAEDAASFTLPISYGGNTVTLTATKDANPAADKKASYTLSSAGGGSITGTLSLDANTTEVTENGEKVQVYKATLSVNAFSTYSALSKNVQYTATDGTVTVDWNKTVSTGGGWPGGPGGWGPPM